MIEFLKELYKNIKKKVRTLNEESSEFETKIGLQEG